MLALNHIYERADYEINKEPAPIWRKIANNHRYDHICGRDHPLCQSQRLLRPSNIEEALQNFLCVWLPTHEGTLELVRRWRSAHLIQAYACSQCST
jgi:hypothetical protein